LSRDQISLEDAIDIRQMKNIKLANELLKMKRKQKQKQDMDNEQQKMQMQTQANIQSSQAAAESKMQQIQAESQAKMQIEQAKNQFEIEKMQAEANLKLQLMEREFQMQMQLKGVEADALKTREKDREKAKDNRVSLQNTQQSKLIEQRQKDLPSINFESTEDTLDGFDLSQFEPR